jgi:hypothetical protein
MTRVKLRPLPLRYWWFSQVRTENEIEYEVLAVRRSDGDFGVWAVTEQDRAYSSIVFREVTLSKAILRSFLEHNPSRGINDPET